MILKEQIKYAKNNNYHPEIISTLEKALNTRYVKQGTGGKDENNKVALSGYLRSPKNKVYFIKNCNHFVRNNPSLFEEEDLIWKTTRKGRKSMVCRASKSLASLFPYTFKRTIKVNPKTTWKGWTFVSQYNAKTKKQEDILQRPTHKGIDQTN